jgi:acetyl-CoA acetyltransferase family protein
MTEAYILDAVRTPFGREDGVLSDWRPDDLLGYTAREFLDELHFDEQLLEDFIVGCVTQVDEQGVNVARMAGLIADLPLETGGVSLNRMCGSGQQAINFGSMAVMSGQHDLVLTGGVESMSNVPISSDASTYSDKLQETWDVLHQGESAERIADEWGFTREELDEFSVESHRRAVDAQDRGFLADEILPVPREPWNEDSKHVEHDGGPRRDTSVEKLAELPAVFREEGGKLTPGSSSQITDGAGVTLIGNEDMVDETGIEPRARIVQTAVAGVDPEIMLTGPIPATREVLDKADLELTDMDTVEVNEAFASVPMAWMEEYPEYPYEQMNPNGGAIALGHPLGATGQKLIQTALNQLEDTGGRYGLVTMCIGFGQATATIIERL